MELIAKEGEGGRGGDAVDAAGSAGYAVLLHRGGTFAFACFMGSCTLS